MDAMMHHNHTNVYTVTCVRTRTHTHTENKNHYNESYPYIFIEENRERLDQFKKEKHSNKLQKSDATRGFCQSFLDIVIVLNRLILMYHIHSQTLNY